MRKWMLRAAEKLCQYSNYWWYGPFIGFWAALDAFVFVIWVEAILFPSVWAHPRKWLSTAFWLTTGSALGAMAFAALVSRYGQPLVIHFFPHLFESKHWIGMLQIIDEHGPSGLAFISVGPFPQHIAVTIAGLAHMKVFAVFGAVFIGRGIKYVLLAWFANHAPRILKKLRILPEDFDLRSSPRVQK